MHWDYQQHQNAPQWMLDLIMPLMETEKDVEKIKSDNASLLKNKGH